MWNVTKRFVTTLNQLLTPASTTPATSATSASSPSSLPVVGLLAAACAYLWPCWQRLPLWARVVLRPPVSTVTNG